MTLIRTHELAGDQGIRGYIRRGIAADWCKADPVLADREVAYELDTDRFKVGDGKTAWNELPYYVKAEMARA
jgi:Major tropism determinant N-terminal domain